MRRMLQTLSGEEVVYEERPDIAVFMPPLSLLFISFVLLSVEVDYLAMFTVLSAAVSGVFACASYFFHDLVVTDRRILSHSGLFGRIRTSIYLNRIESVTVECGIIGRLLGYGKVTITTIGQNPEVFYRVSEPFLFQRHLREQLAANLERSSAA